MKLYYTPNSPYARICRIVADGAGLTDCLELVRVPLRDPENPVIAFSPLGRVPALVDGDLVLTEARHICAYLDEKGAASTPSVAGYKDWPAVAAEAQALAFLDAVTVWSREYRRPEEERSPFLLEVEDEQAARMMAYYDKSLTALTGDLALNFETLCLAVGMGMLQFYDLAPKWRDDYPRLSAWVDAYDAVPIMDDTAPSAAAMNLFTR
jgi:glutathione S-transferase